MFLLDDDEIAELTKRVRPHAQVKRLRAMGIECKPRPGFCPAVLRAHVEHILGGPLPARADNIPEPNWEAVNA